MHYCPTWINNVTWYSFLLSYEIFWILKCLHQSFRSRGKNIINELGKWAPKHCPTYDQTFDYSNNNSVNHRFLKDELHLLAHSHCLLRIMHCINTLCLKLPETPTMMSKVDFKSAYHWWTMKWSPSSQSIAIICSFALLLSCLLLGRSHCQSLQYLASVTIADLVNDLLSCPDCDGSEI